MIEIKGLSTRYAKKSPEVLHDVSFSLRDGGICVMIGPNGAGKSTLFRCLLGLMKYEGSILVDGQELRRLKPKERALRIAYVPQETSFAPSTVYDAVMLGRLPYFAVVPARNDHEVVRSVLRELDMEELASKNVIELSGGQRQKVAIARALAQQAKILLFDEPTSNLDIAAENMVLELVRDLVRQKRLTALLSMHDLNQALGIGEEFALLKQGRLIAYGNEGVVNQENVESVFGVLAKKVRIDDKEIMIFGGKKDEE